MACAGFPGLGSVSVSGSVSTLPPVSILRAQRGSRGPKLLHPDGPVPGAEVRAPREPAHDDDLHASLRRRVIPPDLGAALLTRVPAAGCQSADRVGGEPGEGRRRGGQRVDAGTRRSDTSERARPGAKSSSAPPESRHDALRPCEVPLGLPLVPAGARGFRGGSQSLRHLLTGANPACRSPWRESFSAASTNPLHVDATLIHAEYYEWRPRA